MSAPHQNPRETKARGSRVPGQLWAKLVRAYVKNRWE
jgi:hypothetical protein